MIKMNEGVVVMLGGLLGLLYAMATKSLNIFEKASLLIICSLIIILGVLIQAGVLERLLDSGETDLDDLEDSFG